MLQIYMDAYHFEVVGGFDRSLLLPYFKEGKLLHFVAVADEAWKVTAFVHRGGFANASPVEQVAAKGKVFYLSVIREP